MVTYEGGLSKYSGLIDIAKEGGFVYSPVQGWYRGRDPAVPKDKNDATAGDLHDKSYRLKETNNATFWDAIFNGTNFDEWIESRYALGAINLMEDDEPEVLEADMEFVTED